MSSGGNSADRILAILDVFSEDQLEWTSDELMARLGYSRPTLYRYLRSLKDAGLLTSLPGKAFTLGPRVVELDFLMRKSDPLVREGDRHLRTLAGKHPGTALLVRWYGSKLLCVASECSVPDPISSYPRGRPMPLARGAISRAILAYLPRHQLQAKILKNLPELSRVGLGATAEEVTDALRRVRRAGCAIARGEVTPGVVGIAAPVFDSGKSPIAALCMTIRESDVDEDRIARIAADIWSEAERLSEVLSELRVEDCEDTPRRFA